MKSYLFKHLPTALVTAVLIMLSVVQLSAQSQLDLYVKEGLASNLVVKQRHLSLQQAQQGLHAARSYFLPSVSLLADYTHGEGGRSIALPVGDLLNPVYATLNQMTQSDDFPQIQNVDQTFFPQNFYDARFRTSLPILNTDIHLNRTIQAHQVMMKQYELEAYKRELVLDIKTAYFNLLSADAAVKIYESAEALVNKNVKVNESLLRNGKALPATLIRSKSEAERVKADLNMARNRRTNAQRYFNFLLNRDLDVDVILSDPLFEDHNKLVVPDSSSAKREELKMIETAGEIHSASLRMNQLNRVPKINAFIDVGSQAYNWEYNDQSRYFLAGVQLSLPIFQGFRNNINVRQSHLEVEKTQHQLEVTRQQLMLSASLAENDYQTAKQNLVAAEEQLRSAESYFNLIDKGYREGVNSLIEYLDARNQLTSSELQQSLRKFDVLIAAARIERESASYHFDN